MTTRQGELQEMYPANGETYRYRIIEGEGAFTFDLDGGEFGGETAIDLSIESYPNGEGLCWIESGRARPFAWAWVGPELHLWLAGDLFVFRRAETRRRGGSDAEGTGDVLAPMPGSVLEILVAAGDRVERNQTVAVMESMKMELVITAPRNGVVRRVAVQPGQQVERGMRLLELVPANDLESDGRQGSAPVG